MKYAKKINVMTPFHWMAFIALMMVFASCRRNEVPRMIVFAGEVQGTTYQIKLCCDVDSLALKNGIDSLFRVIDMTASVYDSNSIISKVNSNRATTLNEHFIKLFRKSEEISEKTDGCFDITVAPLVREWGFWQKKGRELSPRQVDSLKNLVDYRKLSIAGDSLVRQNPEMMLDFNAIAQGYTVDVVADYLAGQGCQDFLIEIGGEVRTMGMKNGKDQWIVGIEKPAENPLAEQQLQERIILKDRSMATSGNYRKFIEKDGIKYSHTIDPHTGYPVHHSLLSVTVIAGDCATADAYATAFMVMGLEKSKAFLSSHPEMDAYFIYSDEKGALQNEFTKGFSELIVK